MAEDKDSSPGAAPKVIEQAPWQFRFEQRDGLEAGASLPDLTNQEVRAGIFGEREVIFINGGPDEGKILTFPAEEWLSSFNIQGDYIATLASRFAVSDVSLLKLVIALAIHGSQKSKQYSVEFPELDAPHAADDFEYHVLRGIADSGNDLERKLGALAELGAERRHETAARLTHHRATKKFAEALQEYGQFISRLKVTWMPLPAVRPERADAKRLVVTLARAWTKLTGDELKPYSVSFYKLVVELWQQVSSENAPVQNTVADWVKEVLAERRNRNNAVAANE